MPYITPIKLLRSFIYNKRPSPSVLSDGQPAYNGNADQPGLFFKNSDNQLTKIGPTFIGSLPPNSPSDPNGAGDGSLSIGEQWLDTSGDNGSVLKVWNGSSWVDSYPIAYARALMSPTAPPKEDYPQGTIWWDTETGFSYILYQTDWVQLGSTPSTVLPPTL
jgi:hypothetical protein